MEPWDYRIKTNVVTLCALSGAAVNNILNLYSFDNIREDTNEYH